MYYTLKLVKLQILEQHFQCWCYSYPTSTCLTAKVTSVLTHLINELSLGQAVTLVVETDNPYDNEAVAIYYKDKKLGYVPKEKNSFLSTLLYYGYGDILEARIQYVNVENHPERQFRVVVKIKDNRK